MKNLLIIISFSILFLLYIPSTYAISLESYCQDGYYRIPGEPICSRAPNCGGYGYDELNTEDKMPNPQQCMGDGAGREEKGCAGYVPLCCYEVARTGNPNMCIGYWERLWCAPSQCETISGDKKNCAHAFETYCGNKLPIPLEQRLGIAPQPTQPPPPTNVPPTSIPTSIPTNPPLYTQALRPTTYIPPFTVPTIPIILPTQYIYPTSPSFSFQFPTINIEPLKKSIKNIIIGSERVLTIPVGTIKMVIQLDSSFENIIQQFFLNLIKVFKKN